MKWNLPTLLKLALCSWRNCVGNVKMKGTEDKIHCEKKEIKWKSDETGKQGKSRRGSAIKMCSASGDLFCYH